MNRKFTVVFDMEFDNPPSCFTLSQEKIAALIRAELETPRIKVQNVQVTEHTNTPKQ